MIGKLIYSTISSKQKVEKYQQIIRDNEWDELIKEIPEKKSFLDVGCGAGYALLRAEKDKQCKVTGIDPDPGAHGVGRFIKDFSTQTDIRQGYAENLPFENDEFDVVFSSHVLEHVNNEQKSLQEMKRVLKDDGILIIGMPTASMALINLFSKLFFTTHIKIYEFIRGIFSHGNFGRFLNIFRISSHSYPRANSIWYDIKHYRVKNWQSIVEHEFKIEKVILPCLYPFPDYPQFFKLRKSNRFSSSVFFICSKKKTTPNH
jgi:ubiquinone/menaquinone biosynthesis C-methylase UbiE